MYILPELIYSSESVSEAPQSPSDPPIELPEAPINQPVEPSPVPSTDLEWVRRLGEALVRRRDEMILENSPVVNELAAVIGKITATMNELSAAAADITGKMNRVLAQGDKEPVVTDEKLRQPQLKEGQAMQGDGVAEVILRGVDPHDLARYQAQIAEAKATAPAIEKKQAAEQDEKRRRRRQIYQQYAAKFVGKSVYECDRLVVRQLMSELLAERGGQRLSDDEIGKVGSILLQGPVAQELKQTQGKEAGLKYAVEVLTKERKVVEKAQRRSRDQGMEL